VIETLKPKGVGAILHARHLCMEMRGVQIAGAVTTTSALRGLFLHDPRCRREFLDFDAKTVIRSRDALRAVNRYSPRKHIVLRDEDPYGHARPLRHLPSTVRITATIRSPSFSLRVFHRNSNSFR
jgi:hypothetical protein